MDTMFVVTQCWNDYDDSGSTPILVTPNQDIAQAKVSEMEARKIARKASYDSVCQNMTVWELSNPRPGSKAIREKLLPDFGVRKNKWTAAQKAEYKSVKDSNDAKRYAAAKPFGDWARDRYTEQLRFTTSLPQSDQDDLRELDDKLYWEIETVPYQE